MHSRIRGGWVSGTWVNVTRVCLSNFTESGCPVPLVRLVLLLHQLRSHQPTLSFIEQLLHPVIRGTRSQRPSGWESHSSPRDYVYSPDTCDQYHILTLRVRRFKSGVPTSCIDDSVEDSNSRSSSLGSTAL